MLIDQLIKIIVVDNMYKSSIVIINRILKFTYIENTGGAYGLGNNSITTFIIVNAIIIVLLLKFVAVKKDEVSTQILIGISLMIAGGTGNLIDRIFRGYVIDYIDITPIIEYPVFNVADICVVIGCIIICIKLFKHIIKNKTNL